MHFLYRKKSYTPTGPLPEDYMPENQINNSFSLINSSKNLDDLKKKLYNNIGKKIRPESWRLLLKYTSLSQNSMRVLKTKREEYKNFTNNHKEEKYLKSNDQKIIDTITLINKDVLRTLPDSYIFRNKQVQNSIKRILLIYSIRHPSNQYAQGMNDIVAPIFAVYISELFNTDYITLENNIRQYEKSITEKILLKAEADTYYSLSLLLLTMKANYLKGFQGVHENLRKLDLLLKKSDINLYNHLKNNDVEVYHFGFRWCFCLLMREFPIELSIKVIDFYLVEDYPPIELCVYLMLALLLKFSFRVKKLQREQIIMFLQNLPTQNWGEEDIKILVAEAFTLRSFFDLN